jgi:hypothetical protein
MPSIHAITVAVAPMLKPRQSTIATETMADLRMTRHANDASAMI